MDQSETKNTKLPTNQTNMDAQPRTVRKLEDPSIKYEDGDTTMYLYTKGTVTDGKQELVELLNYIEDSKQANAKNKKLKKIHDIVQKVKCDKEVGVAYMREFERERMIREKAHEEARKEEQKNTERERLRAERAEKEVEKQKQEANKLKQDAEDRQKNSVRKMLHRGDSIDEIQEIFSDMSKQEILALK